MLMEFVFHEVDHETRGGFRLPPPLVEKFIRHYDYLCLLTESFVTPDGVFTHRRK